MQLHEKRVSVRLSPGDRGPIEQIEKALSPRFADGEIPLRLAVTSIDGDRYRCEIGCLAGGRPGERQGGGSIFEFRRRGAEKADRFNAVFLVPTGIGAEIGGHAGDATPAARLLAAGCDRLITHPNVVNASDINEIPANALYVEGSVICRLLMGTAGLKPVRANRVLVVIDAQADEMIENLALNTVEAARATYGLTCAGIYRLDPPLELTATYADSGRAVGTGHGIGRLFDLLGETRDDYDAVAISSLIAVPDGYHDQYFTSGGDMVNPWGGVEAMLTHAVSHFLDVPSAHAPMMESREVLFGDPGRVDPRMAAEAISSSFFQCVLKGLKQSPSIVADPSRTRSDGVLTVEDVSCLVLPDGCVGLPTLAALEQGIPVIAVREGKGLMANDLTALPWRPGQLTAVENYWEAAGVLGALRAGIAPESVRRPFAKLEAITWRETGKATSPEPIRRLPGFMKYPG
ncbi:MAG: DUF3326 domain-containing protein [Rhodospirillales bacterium]|jgi:hypothetical protein|nr:DUF3326 domain-containing protein [Rhodospirillales bacterium]HIJ43535.1 DUF3326 domain-containing protein [Rhodospirillaceae bacterium]MDP7214641.1 DUF3326 domain-containing protein [Rhodospirillales bacterium]HIJ45792.1 DUF3326 domain-containing protein [Rhodospirillaceae bacterium]HIJ92468.1 DUF3326 domain-containing protein [Rhodospirillaceae bacterium]